MRNMLLGTVFALGAMGTVFAAETADQPNPMTGTMIMKPGPTPGANNNNNAFGTARPGASAVPTPGTMVIHMNARVQIEYFNGWNSLMNSVPGFAATSQQMGSYIRLYGGADGMAANGMRYGGAFEVRQNFVTATARVVVTPSTTNPASNASAGTSAQTLYVRRAFIYVGADKYGIVRVGQGDDLITLFDAGQTTLQTYSPTSHFNGSDLQTAIGGNSAPPFVFISGSGDVYDTQKFVYLSPNVSGFDFGLQYSPSAFNSLAGCGGPATGCSNLITSGVAADGARFINMVGAGARYSGPIGPVNVLAYGVYNYAGHVNYSGTAAAARTAVGAPAGSSWNGQFDNPSFGSMGVALTYSGFTVGANYITGAINGRLAARPSGGATMQGILVGVQYKSGPFAIGAVYESILEQGAVAMTGLTQRQEYAVSFGGSYRVAPGLVLFADYLYQNRKQSGWNFLTNTAGTSNNVVHGQGFVLGTQMTW